MVVVKTVNDDILNAKEDYIAQQCNCNTIKCHGLSKYISDKYPWANPYSRRKSASSNSTSAPDVPGTIIEMQNPRSPHIILCLMAQWLPSKPNAYKQYYPTTYDDTYENRKKWFQKCLDIIDRDYHHKIAVPYGIGCGLAGGKWNEYKAMLEEAKTEFVLYKL